MSSAIPTGIVNLMIRIMRYPIKGSIKNWQNRPIHIPFQFRNCLRISRMSTVLAIPITKKKRRRCVTTVAQIIISDVVVEDKIMCLLECSRAMKACVVDFTQCYSQEYLPSDIMSLLLWCHRDISCQKYLAYLVSKLRTSESWS